MHNEIPSEILGISTSPSLENKFAGLQLKKLSENTTEQTNHA